MSWPLTTPAAVATRPTAAEERVADRQGRVLPGVTITTADTPTNAASWPALMRAIIAP
jgi:hypothetical protein